MDYYKVTLTSQSDLNIHVDDMPSSRNYDLYLYDSNNNLLASSTNTVNKAAEDITMYALASGTYYIKVIPVTYDDYDTLYYSLSINDPSYQGPTSTWNYTDYSHGSYVPLEGTLATRFFDGQYDNYAKTWTGFTLNPNNVASILDYNDGGVNPGGSAYDNINNYLTVDISSVRDGLTDQMDAYSIISNLPNPKYDLENDDITGTRLEETEVVALGSVEAKHYYVTSYWHDYRAGAASDSGKWQVQFGMSKQGLSDYNNFLISDVIQAIVNYGDNGGRP